MRGRGACWLLLLPFAFTAASADDDEAALQAQLRVLREQIAELAAEQHALADRRGDVVAQVRAADREVERAAAALVEADRGIAEHGAALAALEVERMRREAALAEQREQLAVVIRGAYALGRHAPLKLLLAQERWDTLGRALAYQAWFRHERVRRIETLLGEVAELAALHERQAGQRQRLEESRAAQASALARTDAERAARRELLAELEREARGGRARLTALERDETALLALIDRLRDLFADIPERPEVTASVASQAGRLPRPHPGPVRRAFGTTGGGAEPSRGWWIEAASGDPVRAIAHGRVAFADWLNGYGLIVIVDHGEGFLSLYAGHDSLLRAAGDWVERGEVLAHAGASGGQSGPGLYFELRRGGRPVDPARWLARR